MICSPENESDSGSDENPSEDDLDPKETSEILLNANLADLGNNFSIATESTNLDITRPTFKLKKSFLKDIIPRKVKRLAKINPMKGNLRKHFYIEMIDAWTQTNFEEIIKDPYLQKVLVILGLVMN